MVKKVTVIGGVDERSPLIDNHNDNSETSNSRESYRRRSSTSVNETTKAKRFRAIRICYFGMFVSSIVFSITVSSLWPFLQIVDKSAEATFLGWLVAAFSIGQLIASPLIGYVANRTDNNTMPLVISTALIVVSNILYAYVESINNFGLSNKWWIMLARFIMGIGAANSTIMRSYASSATTVAERTSVMANLSAYQGVGFILGPLIQALFAFLGYPGPFHKPWLYFNIYTAPAFFSALTGAVNLLLFLFAFSDVRIAAPSRKSINGIICTPRVSAAERHDQLMAIICCLYMFFVAYLTFTNYETIASPLSIDMYAWSKEQSTRNNGYILGILGVMSVFVLIVTKLLARCFQDRVLMLLGMVISFIGYFVFLPWGTDYPSVQIASFTPTTATISPYTSAQTTIISTSIADSDDKGCPLDYQWCYTVPRVQLWQYIMASVVITIGFSICNVICYSIFSKKLGDRPQGTMMGIFTSAGSLARAFGPITVGFLYKHWGPRVMMIFMLVFVMSSILALIFNYQRLFIEPEPPEDLDEDEENNINNTRDDTFISNGGDTFQTNRHNILPVYGDNTLTPNGNDTLKNNGYDTLTTNIDDTFNSNGVDALNSSNNHTNE